MCDRVVRKLKGKLISVKSEPDEYDRRCIYCETTFKKVRGKNDDHVFPQALGCPDDFVLDCVCPGCNQGFGGTIERYLTRDTIEGAMAVQLLGSRSGESIKRRRLFPKVESRPEYGVYQGALYGLDVATAKVALIPQAGFQNPNGEQEYFAFEDIRLPVPWRKLRVHFAGGARRLHLITNRESERPMLDRLKSIGIFLGNRVYSPIPKPLQQEGFIPVTFQGLIDRNIHRAVAKIAFNYAAKTKGAEFLLQPLFNRARLFIRDGSASAESIVKNVSTEQAVTTLHHSGLHLPEKGDQTFQGHVFILQANDNELIGTVSLFGVFKYEYLLGTSSLALPASFSTGNACILVADDNNELKETKIVPLLRMTGKA